jgi:hypothetical protein
MRLEELDCDKDDARVTGGTAMAPEQYDGKGKGQSLDTEVAVLAERVTGLTKRLEEVQTSQNAMALKQESFQTAVSAKIEGFQHTVNTNISNLDTAVDAKIDRLQWMVAKIIGAQAILIPLLLFLLNKWGGGK